MIDEAEMRAVFRRVVDEGGDVVDLADIAIARGWGGRGCLRTARALRREFKVSLMEALHFAVWIEHDGIRDAASRDELRAGIATRLR
ncbi:hypothetical protein [Actinoplanes ianthinogenes]|uniref:hypothetical protein n=1 Tax=Actinoplanes ianthinogenes TaxID=122358 RepID=UPI001670E415|nr:hypothetical protein [Actinoplanes ianthinogenes]